MGRAEIFASRSVSCASVGTYDASFIVSCRLYMDMGVYVYVREEVDNGEELKSISILTREKYITSLTTS